MPARPLPSAVRTALSGALRRAEEAGVVALVGARNAGTDVRVLTTGLIDLDAALATDGWPAGVMAEIYGPPSSGKTSLALASVAEAQRRGIGCAWLDSERTLTADHARMMGADPRSLILPQAETGEDAVQILERLLVARAAGLVVVDSVAALVPKAELAAAVGAAPQDAHRRLLARAVAALRRVQGEAVLLMVNQTRVRPAEEGGLEVAAGGVDLARSADIRLRTRRAGVLVRDDAALGIRMGLTIDKNLFGPPFRTATADLVFGRGFALAAETLDWALRLAIARATPEGILLHGEVLGADRPAALSALSATPHRLSALRRAVRQALSAPSPGEEPEASDA